MQSTFDMRHGVEEENYKEKKKERNSQSIVTRRKWRRLCRVSAPKDTSSRRPRLQWAESAVLHVSSAENRHVRSVHGRLHAGSDIYLFVFFKFTISWKIGDATCTKCLTSTVRSGLSPCSQMYRIQRLRARQRTTSTLPQRLL